MHYSLGESTIQNMALDACNTYLALNQHWGWNKYSHCHFLDA